MALLVTWAFSLYQYQWLKFCLTSTDSMM